MFTFLLVFFYQNLSHMYVDEPRISTWARYEFVGTLPSFSHHHQRQLSTCQLRRDVQDGVETVNRIAPPPEGMEGILS